MYKCTCTMLYRRPRRCYRQMKLFHGFRWNRAWSCIAPTNNKQLCVNGGEHWRAFDSERTNSLSWDISTRLTWTGENTGEYISIYTYIYRQASRGQSHFYHYKILIYIIDIYHSLRIRIFFQNSFFFHCLSPTRGCKGWGDSHLSCICIV